MKISIILSVVMLAVSLPTMASKFRLRPAKFGTPAYLGSFFDSNPLRSSFHVTNRSQGSGIVCWQVDLPHGNPKFTSAADGRFEFLTFQSTPVLKTHESIHPADLTNWFEAPVSLANKIDPDPSQRNFQSLIITRTGSDPGQSLSIKLIKNKFLTASVHPNLSGTHRFNSHHIYQQIEESEAFFRATGKVEYADLRQVGQNDYVLAIVQDNGGETLEAALYPVDITNSQVKVSSKPVPGSRLQIPRSALGIDVPQLKSIEKSKGSNLF